MKSICIKTNDTNLIKYLLNEFNYLDIDNICFSENKFKYYKNVIIHYNGTNIKSFINKISEILSYLVIDELEDTILKKLLLKNYFYFNSIERNKIIEICSSIFIDDFNDFFIRKYNCLVSIFSSYLNKNKSIVLNGFINFRLQPYFGILENGIDKAVNAFLIEREYSEFVSLLKLYINSQNDTCNMVHLVYFRNNSILLDEHKNVINVSDDIFKAKFLSDINFSANDYVLNGLLTLIPKKIYIHLVENYIDEFIETLGLIFENRVEYCNDCNICKIYSRGTVLCE